jgi:FkbM family methyltransferase
MYLQSTSCGEIGLILHQILFKILGYKTDGFFIEIGANDGKTGSFTYNLSKIGWSGLYFEPIPRLYNLCKENHKDNTNVKIINIGIGNKKEQLQIIDADTLSTLDDNTLNLYQNTDWTKNNFKDLNKINVNIDTLNNLLDLNFDNNINIDLLIIDVEGFEQKVLEGFTINKYNPKIIIIEIADQHPTFINNKDCMDKYKFIRSYLKLNNYLLLVNDIVDNVYLYKDYFDLNDKNYFSSMVKYPQFIN